MEIEMSEAVDFTTPVGRLVGGSVYKFKDKDGKGAPLVIKFGTNVGKPYVQYWMALAIAKGPEQHWSQTPWGKVIWDVGVKAFGQIASNPAFAWKITDGDNRVPNKKGNIAADNEGYPGHWVLNFGGTYAPKVVNKDGSAYLLEPDAVKAGYYIQIAGSVADNKPSESPGVYLNYSLVSLQAFGAEITQGPDPLAVGFGQSPLPAGASATPVGGMPLPAPVAPIPAEAMKLAVVPNPAFLTAAPPPPVPAGPVMTAKANGIAREVYIQNGWTDVQLREHGYMV
jgi:hypothetical protein